MVRNTIAPLKLMINPFHATDLFWYPLKISENLCFSNVFRGYQKRSVAWNGLMTSHDYQMRYNGNFKISEQIYFLRSYENTEVKTYLRIKTYHYQFQKKYNPSQNTLELFLSVILVSFHLKWNRTRSLSLQSEYTSYLKSCEMT